MDDKWRQHLCVSLFQGEEGEQGMLGEVGAQGLPVKYFTVSFFSHTLYLHFIPLLTVKHVNMGCVSLSIR